MARAILHVGSIHLGRFLSEFRWTAGPSAGSGEAVAEGRGGEVGGRSNLIAKNSGPRAAKLPSFRSFVRRPSLPPPCGADLRELTNFRNADRNGTEREGEPLERWCPSYPGLLAKFSPRE